MWRSSTKKALSGVNSEHSNTGRGPSSSCHNSLSQAAESFQSPTNGWTGAMSVPNTPPRRPAKRELTSLTSSQSTPTLNGGHKSHDPAIERALQLSTFEVSSPFRYLTLLTRSSPTTPSKSSLAPSVRN